MDKNLFLEQKLQQNWRSPPWNLHEAFTNRNSDSSTILWTPYNFKTFGNESMEICTELSEFYLFMLKYCLSNQKANTGTIQNVIQWDKQPKLEREQII